MEPVSTLLISMLTYWGGKAFDKVFDTTAGEFTKDSIKWLKSLFFKDDEPKEVLEAYEAKPDSPARQNAIKATIEKELEDNPKAMNYLSDILKAVETKCGGAQVVNSKNVNTGGISAGGNVTLGDNNQTS